jgi:hypothetical protein
MAFKLGIQVNNGNYCRALVALREYDSHMLSVGCLVFYGIPGTSCIIQIAFIIIDVALLHGKPDFFLGDMPAFHPASRVLTIFQIGYPSVKTPVAIHFFTRSMPT